MRSTVIFALALFLSGCTQAGDENHLAGTVLETLDVPSYTYVHLETADGEKLWAAIPQTRLELGTQVVIGHPTIMNQFESKTLGRTFDEIHFGTLEGDRPIPAAKSKADTASIEVTKAEGANGRTVAEIHAGGGDLSGKTVSLRGRVVKYNGGIMGRNWIHLQDGSGDAGAGTNDILVTSSDSTTVGEIILIEGTVATNKDFGSGYSYAIIVENARVK
jgi:hypothetical protein